MVVAMSKSVKEIADILGCSVQAVYNRLEKDFKPYLKIENGKKRIDDEVLQYIEKEKNSSDFSSDFKLVLNLLEKQNAQLEEELKVKNTQIAELQRLLDQQQQLQLQTLQKPATLLENKQSLFKKIFSNKK